MVPRAGRLLCVVFCVAVSQFGLRGQALPSASSAGSLAPNVKAALDEGLGFEERKQLTSAEDSMQRALKLSGRQCAPCLDALLRVQRKMEHYKDAAGTAGQMAASAPDAKGRAQAEFLQGAVWFSQYLAQAGVGEDGEPAAKQDKRAPGWLKDAETSLARAVADDPGNADARMLHGRVLAAQRRDAEASNEFTACASTPGASPEDCARATHFAKNVALARGTPAPKFTIATIDGKTISSESLAGKIVLIDFWATWCTYCRRDSDYVQSILDKFDDGRFVLLEVDVDDSEADWRRYVKENRLHGVQTRDGLHDVREAFHVSGYPTYIVLDGDGMTRLRVSGAQGDLRTTVRKLLEGSSDATKTLPKSAEE